MSGSLAARERMLLCQSGMWRKPGGVGLSQQFSGTCQPPRSTAQTCYLADRTWYCALSGVSGAGQDEDGYIYLTGSGWFMYTYRGDWPARYRYTCFK